MTAWFNTHSQPLDIVLQSRVVTANEGSTSQAPRERRIFSIASDELLVETQDGFWIVVPTWNLDVIPGIVRDGFIEPWTKAVFESCIGPSDTVVNVGANFGFYSLLAANVVGRTGKVFAVEANPVVFRYLAKSMYWAGYPDVIRAFQAACVGPDLHDRPIRIQFDPQFIGGGSIFVEPACARSLDDSFWSSANIGETLTETRQFGPRALTSEAMTVGKTLDAIVGSQTPVDCMLIDVEGSECMVIQGAHNTIRNSPRLSIIMEWDPRSFTEHPDRRDKIDAMWRFLLEDERFVVSRICCEGYGEAGTMPKLVRLDRNSLMQVPHCDLLLRRDR